MIAISVMAGMILFGWYGLMLAICRDGSCRPYQGQGDQQKYCEKLLHGQNYNRFFIFSDLCLKKNDWVRTVCGQL